MSTFLHSLARHVRDKKRRTTIIKKATKKELNTLRNLCYHLCCNQYNVPTKTRRDLKPWPRDIRDLANPRKLKTKNGVKARLIQRGGFLPLLLPVLTGVLSTVAGELIGRAV